ncbi:MAG TPA: hypothetical protein VHC22_02610 [Pirellulales bacterium]|nr:hypothetical protein [Pirellulales bacterium]
MQTGEIWRLRIDHEFRRVRIVGAAGIIGWWRCVDLATDVTFLARDYWFVERQTKPRPSTEIS